MSSADDLLERVSTHVRVRTWLPIIAMPVLVFLQLVSPHRAWILLLSAMVGTTGAAYLWARSLSRHVRLTRSLRFRVAQVGDWLEENLVLQNDGRWPLLWAEMIDESNVPGYPRGRVVATGSDQAYHWEVSVPARRRGAYRLGPWSVTMREPFGFFSVVQTYDQHQDLLVVPAVMRPPTLTLPHGIAAGRAVTRGSSADATVSVSATREYTPSDPLRHIHWASSAHAGRLMAKTFDTEVSGDVWLVLDLDASVQAGEDEESTEEYQVILAASLAEQLLRANQAVGLAAHGNETVHLVPARGESQLWYILRRLATVRAQGSYPLSALMSDLRAGWQRQATVILITPSTNPDWVSSVGWLLQRGMLPTAVLLDAASFGGPAGTEVVRDLVARLAVPHLVIGKGHRFELSRRSAEQAGVWEFKVTPLGRAVSVRTPRESTA